jgi:hypothetical protein
MIRRLGSLVERRHPLVTLPIDFALSQDMEMDLVTALDGTYSK